jgi:hypothetical protein
MSQNLALSKTVVRGASAMTYSYYQDRWLISARLSGSDRLWPYLALCDGGLDGIRR